jgi:hypothetical protein
MREKYHIPIEELGLLREAAESRDGALKIQTMPGTACGVRS